MSKTICTLFALCVVFLVSPAHSQEIWNACNPNQQYSSAGIAMEAQHLCSNPTQLPHGGSRYEVPGFVYFKGYHHASLIRPVPPPNELGVTMSCRDGFDPVGSKGGAPARCVKQVNDNSDDGCKNGVFIGNPVSVRNGNKVQHAVDWTSGGGFPLEFSRYYSTLYVSAHAPLYSSLGPAWRSNFGSTAAYVRGATIALPSTPVTGDRLHIVLPSHTEHSFKFNGTVWQPVLSRINFNATVWDVIRTDTRDRLSVGSTSFTFTDKTDTGYTFDASGVLQEIQLPNGLRRKLEYSGNQLAKVTDSLGRWLRFKYSQSGTIGPLLREVLTSDGKTLLYDYVPLDGTGTTETSGDISLGQVTFPDNTPAVNTDNPKQIFSYYAIPFDINIAPYNSFPLASITDEKGVIYASWTYDARGRATSSFHAGGADEYSLSYDDVNNKTTVTNPLGKQTIYSFNKLPGNIMRLTQVDGQATANCAQSNTAYTYDAAGFRNQATDAEGRVMQWVNNARGLPTSEIRGVGTPSAVTETMQWDANRPLLTQRVQPGKTANITYTTDGNPATLAEIDTTSTTMPYNTNGQTRTTAFTYTSFGMPAVPALTAPGTALSDLTLPVLNANASGGVANWVNQTGTLATSTTGVCTGNSCFSYGTGTSAGEWIVLAYQDVAIPAGAVTDVDAQRRALQFGWRQMSQNSSSDPGYMKVEFRNASGTVLSTAFEFAKPFAAWTQRGFTRPVPMGTRILRIYMGMKWIVGVQGATVFDDITA
jgi:YD repeat-containing protein